jgi:hypothetical protein
MANSQIKVSTSLVLRWEEVIYKVGGTRQFMTLNPDIILAPLPGCVFSRKH